MKPPEICSSCQSPGYGFVRCSTCRGPPLRFCGDFTLFYNIHWEYCYPY